MFKLNHRKNLLIMPIMLSLIVAPMGLAGLSFSHQTAQAQDEATIYLPLTMNKVFIPPPETIMILTPGNSSTVTSPIHISGEADSTFEQNLVVRVLDANGDVLAEEPTMIQADLGERGPYELDLHLDLDTEENIFIQVFDESARDGNVIHLSSVGVTFSPDGPEDIIVREPYREVITIFQPQLGDIISGGNVHVAGFGLASFEQTLVVEVQDEEGDVIAQEPVIVDSPEWGIPGFFQVDIAYSVTYAQPGRIVVRDISPAHGDNVHLTSVEVTLHP
ncbi:MAG: Gmad2 immunoglobulin-like domain-containing protein [Anaerolineales bacterium]